MKIAIDAMGGDFAPNAAVDAAKQAAEQHPDDQFILFGDEAAINGRLGNTRPANLLIEATTEVIHTGDEPVSAVRHKKDASMVRAAKAVKKGDADALVSAGNTGALLTVATIIVGRVRGIDRAALLVDIPNLQHPGQSVAYIDAGANAEAKSQYLQQYAVMASRYAEEINGIENPRVALVNNGTEAAKGSPLTKEAYQLLSETPDIHFIGNIESRDILADVADVIVTDGFTGNAILKAIEGTGVALAHLLKDSLKESGFLTKLGAGLLYNGLKDKLKTIDYRALGGGMFFGVKRPVLKAHGNAEAPTLLSTIEQARRVVSTGLYDNLAAIFKAQYEKQKAEQNAESMADGGN